MLDSDHQALAEVGQQLSLGILLPDDYANFDRIIRSYDPGTYLSINTVRSQLDALAIPDSARGGLFNRAIKAGWLKPAMAVAGGQEFPITEPSTGTSAHNARVRVYVRTDPNDWRR